MKRLTDKEVKEKMLEVHKGFYDYSKFKYVNSRTKSTIICPKHGEFEQSFKLHRQGIGCKECGKSRMTGRKKGTGDTTEQFIEKAKKVHGDLYDYSKVDYKTNKVKVILTCKKHGDFNIRPNGHLDGRGCAKCGINKRSTRIRDSITITNNDYKDRCNKIHSNKYDYSLVNYRRMHDTVIITCPTHGKFEQVADYHKNGRGCPKCSHIIQISKSEQELFDFIYNLDSTAQQSNRTILDKKEIDIFIPSKNLGIEFNGLYWHSEIFKDKEYHHSKYVEAKSKGVQLITIYEDDWKYKKELVKSFLKNKIGVFNKKLNARQGIIKDVPYKIAKDFLNSNHLQGSTSASYYKGLYIKDELVSLILFKKESTGEYNLVRFCSKTGYLVRGGFSKLMKNFVNFVDSNNIITFSDNTYSDGGLYTNNNFSIVKTLPPDYKYIIGDKREHKFNFRKKKLNKMFSNTNSKTEREIMLENNLYRIYDCGKVKYKYNI